MVLITVWSVQRLAGKRERKKAWGGGSLFLKEEAAILILTLQPLSSMPPLRLFPAFLSRFCFSPRPFFLRPLLQPLPLLSPKAQLASPISGCAPSGAAGSLCSRPPRLLPLPPTSPPRLCTLPVTRGPPTKSLQGQWNLKDETKLGHMVHSPDVAFLLPRPTSPLPAAGAAPRPFGQVHRPGRSGFLQVKSFVSLASVLSWLGPPSRDFLSRVIGV